MMAGRRFNKRNPGSGKFARGGVVINGRKDKRLSKKVRRAKNQAKHYSARTKNRTAHALNRPKTAQRILTAAAGVTAAYIAYENFKELPLGRQLDNEVRSRFRFRSQAPEGSLANGTPLKGQRISSNASIANEAKREVKAAKRRKYQPGEQTGVF
jgi:hypothetical protein